MPGRGTAAARVLIGPARLASPETRERHAVSILLKKLTQRHGLISVNIRAAKHHDICIHWEDVLLHSRRRHDMKRTLVIVTAIAFMAANVSSAFSQGGEPNPPRSDVKSGKKSSNTGTPTSTSSGQTKK
jgi:hypothetical protein